MKPLVILTRSHQVESIHYGAICISDHNKKLHFCIGNPSRKIYLRSSAKPFQAVPLLLSEAMEHFGITKKEELKHLK